PTFRHNSDQPFGCMVFDSVMNKSLPKGYDVTQHSLTAIEQEMDSTGKTKNVLLVGKYISFSEKDIKAIKRLLNRGAKVMLIGSSPDYIHEDKYDSLFISSFGMYFWGDYYFDKRGLISSLEGKTYMNDTVVWNKGVNAYPKCTYIYSSSLNSSRLIIEDSVNVKPVVCYSYELSWSTLIGVRKYGKGQLILAGTPLLCTNYGVLNKDTRGLVFRIMSLISDREVVRTEVFSPGIYDEDTYVQKTPLDLIKSNKPLLWAWRLMILTLFVFIIFNMRRRQKVIPVIERPRNHSLEYIKLVGTLFYQNHDNADLVRKKFGLMKDDILKKTGIDLGDETVELEDYVMQLSHRTGLDSGEIRSILVRTLNIVNNTNSLVPPDKMVNLIDGMNEIQKNL
nr:DUF4350 domain-containing protein [Bacteroidaceae bacterium]